MRRAVFSGFRVLAAAGLVAAALAGRPGDTAHAGAGNLLPAGEAAPMFDGVDINGQAISLKEELSSGAVFLVFWSIF